MYVCVCVWKILNIYVQSLIDNDSLVVILAEMENKHGWVRKKVFITPSKLKAFAGNNFEFDKDGRIFSKRVENVVGKGEIAC